MDIVIDIYIYLYFMILILCILLIYYCIFIFNIKYKGYNNLLKDYKHIKYTPGGIPKIIIKTSWQKRNNFPTELNKVLDNTIIINPDYNLYYFDDDEIELFMKSYSERAYNAYKKLIPGAFKADLFRYCILEKYGGCYSDIGHITYVSFDEICQNNELVLVKDLFNSGIHNALMCSIPHNFYIKNLVEKCIQNIESEYYGYCSLSITGPVLAGTVFYKIILNELNEYNFNDSIEKNKVMFNKYIIPGTNKNIRILELKTIGNISTTNNDNNYIVDKNNNILIRSKFENYYKLMYVNQFHYQYYWLNKEVYNI